MFPIKDGETFDTHKISKGLENLRKAYGEIGYINFTSVPETDIDDEKKLLTLNIDVEEGKPFFTNGRPSPMRCFPSWDSCPWPASSGSA